MSPFIYLFKPFFDLLIRLFVQHQLPVLLSLIRGRGEPSGLRQDLGLDLSSRRWLHLIFHVLNLLERKGGLDELSWFYC